MAIATIRPCLAFTNLFEDSVAVVTTSTEAVGFERENLYDWKTYSFWKPTATGDSWVKADLVTARSVTYFAFYNHTLHTNAGTIKLQYSSDNVAWSDATGAIAPTTNAPYYTRFNAISARYWRVLINSNPVSAVAVAAFGTDLVLERGFWVGFSPPILARDTETDTVESDSGAFLGRSVKRQGSTTAVDLSHLTAAWVNTYWLPFMRHAEVKPFFMLWDRIDHSTEAAYCHINKPLDRPKYIKNLFMSAGFSARAFVE